MIHFIRTNFKVVCSFFLLTFMRQRSNHQRCCVVIATHSVAWSVGLSVCPSVALVHFGKSLGHIELKCHYAETFFI